MSEQTYTSKNTSVNITKVPAIYNRINWDKIRKTFPQKNKFSVFDFGCGREWKHIAKYMREKGWAWFGFDPYWENFTSDFNVFDTMLKSNLREPEHLCVILTSNVLNVIDDMGMIGRIQQYCSQDPNLIYFHKIYRGDKSGIPKVTKVDCFQWNKPAEFYINHQFDVVKGGEYITHSLYTQFLKSK